MYYCISVQPLPEIQESDMLIRKTVWKCADKRNILVYIREGACIFTINDTEYVLKKGQMILIPAGQPYVRSPYNDMECQMVYNHFKTHQPITMATHDTVESSIKSIDENIEKSLISADLGTKIGESVIFLTQIIDTDEKTEQIFELLNEIYQESKKRKHYNQLYISSKFLELLVHLGRTVISELQKNQSEPNSRYPKQLQKAIFYINKNYKVKITVDELCSYCNISPQHLVRLFHKHLNTTPIQYINRNKISHAIEMLRSTNLSINEISFELGFDDPNYFRRLFKKEEKRSPSALREYLYKNT